MKPTEFAYTVTSLKWLPDTLARLDREGAHVVSVTPQLSDARMTTTALLNPEEVPVLVIHTV